MLTSLEVSFAPVLSLVLAVGVIVALSYLRTWRAHLITQTHLKALVDACQQGANLAYGMMAESGVAGATSSAKAEAINAGVEHVLLSAPGAIAAIGIRADQLHRMVLARFGGLLAVDPTVSVGPGPIIASAMAAASRIVAVQSTAGS